MKHLMLGHTQGHLVNGCLFVSKSKKFFRKHWRYDWSFIGKKKESNVSLTFSKFNQKSFKCRESMVLILN